MKIKSVCEATGLTDRTVRYYIEEGLITPSYTENYLGRKTFEFSDSDIRTLNDIAVLRKFGFSIAEIKEMILDPDKIIRIVLDLQNRKRTVIHEEQQLLRALESFNYIRSYTITELAECLSAPVANTPLPMEDTRHNVRKITGRGIAYAILTWAPVAVALMFVIIDLRAYYYPKVNPIFILLTLLSLSPTCFFLLLPKIGKKFKWKSIAEIVLQILLLLSMEINIILSPKIIQCSETTDLQNYLRLDPECAANRNVFFHEMFPSEHPCLEYVIESRSNAHWRDAYYYYRYSLDRDHYFYYTYDIYAEWPLEKWEYKNEVNRVKELFDEKAADEEYKSKLDYMTIQKGSYECMIFYSGDKPFEKATDNYTYYIFAYDEENLKVRYIYCDSLENGVDQPYYLSLDWQ